MEIHSNFSLKKHNTFGIDAHAKEFVAIQNIGTLQQVLQSYANKPKFILGGGSNMLLTKDIDALVLHIDLKGKKIIDENDDFVLDRKPSWRKLARICALDYRARFWRFGKHVAHTWKCRHNTRAKYWGLWY